MDNFAARHPDRLKIHYVLNEAPANWQGSVGFVTPEIIDTHLPKASNDTNLLLCGPPPMVSAMKKAAVELGFQKLNQFLNWVIKCLSFKMKRAIIKKQYICMYVLHCMVLQNF